MPDLIDRTDHIFFFSFFLFFLSFFKENRVCHVMQILPHRIFSGANKKVSVFVRKFQKAVKSMGIQSK